MKLTFASSLLHEETVFFDGELLLAREFLHGLDMVFLQRQVCMLDVLDQIRRHRSSPVSLV
eukprot:CAMPEP_0185599880 /NCGR_PEP_ID=MMETSP0434-20130131/83004_1 /TAXON_ID=626734 ORGANISM="Favella taraikaensis, Strain Fe Narragansett Bay" /NCGR_SAMPLE_ID=MMETSP0434 /ASSEMBLY_ACC=CAM_ASM_000379 /LENGTH=60 /DNA_ID=CAMNT_0028229441 /DNA_START=2549 /DNA_END=2731 /DNA_ORIENTATION=+